MEYIKDLALKFQEWYLIQRQKFLAKQLSKLPSDNQDDYYYDNLTNQFIVKDTILLASQQNTLEILKSIESLSKNAIKQEKIGVEIKELKLGGKDGIWGLVPLQEGYLYNQMTVFIRKGTGSGSWFDVDIRLMTDELNDVMYETNIVFWGVEARKTFSFNPTKLIYLDLVNMGSSEIVIDYAFTYSHYINPNTTRLHSKINQNTSRTFYFKDNVSLFNRAIVQFKSSSTLDFEITAKTNNSLLEYETLFTRTVVAGTTYYEIIEFNEIDKFTLLLDNNHLTADLYFNIILFFSKSGGGGGCGFHSREPASGKDFDEGSLTINGSWHSLDLSALVGVDAIAVGVWFGMYDNYSTKFAMFRKEAGSNTTFWVYGSVANKWNCGYGVVQCVNGVIQYYIQTGTNAVDMNILCWWE